MFNILFIIIIYFIYKELDYYELKTFNIFNSFTKINSFATLHKNVHDQMIELILPEILLIQNLRTNLKQNIIKILEIGAGNGMSTINFINKLKENNIQFDYVANEYYDKYKNDLLQILPEEKILIMPFENINSNNEIYDIILLTASSAINDKNINSFRKFANNDTKIVTIYPYILKSMLEKYFIINKYERCSYLLDIYLVNILNLPKSY